MNLSLYTQVADMLLSQTRMVYLIILHLQQIQFDKAEPLY